MILSGINPEAVALLFARVILGILFFMQGYDKIFNISLREVIETTRQGLSRFKLPGYVFTWSVYFTSYAQWMGGILLILGIFKLATLCVLCVSMVVAVAGMSLAQPLVDLKHVFPRIVLILFLLLYPFSADVYSLDQLFGF